MRTHHVVGLLLIFGAIILGLYVGLYLLLYKGIILIIDGIKEGLIGSKIALGIIKVLFSFINEWAAFRIIFIPGLAMLLMED